LIMPNTKGACCQLDHDKQKGSVLSTWSCQTQRERAVNLTATLGLWRVC